MTTSNVNYLRISITDRCNERCLYCMPEGYLPGKAQNNFLSYGEILRIIKAAVDLGFKRFRITGGEPLIREGVPDLIRDIKKINGVESVGLSTNGTRFASMASELKNSGLDSVNFSLDALQPDLYKKITGGDLKQVMNGINEAIRVGFQNIKINAVLMRGINEGEIWALVHFAAEHGLILRFIELMPVSLTEVLTPANFFPVGEIMHELSVRDKLIYLNDVKHGHGPAKYYYLAKTKVTVGIIGAITDLHFCDSCNKIRLTADGKLRPCLGNHGEYDLKPVLRNNCPDETLMEVFRLALREKPLEHQFRNHYQPGRVMTAIGG